MEYIASHLYFWYTKKIQVASTKKVQVASGIFHEIAREDVV